MKLSGKTLILLFLCIAFKFNAQVSNSKSSKSSPEERIKLCQEMENTYQVIVSNPRLKVVLTSDVCEVVKRERKKSETILYKYDTYITLKIYSEEELKKIKTPLEKIIYSGQ
jgi:hypothetical protein